MKRKGYIVLGKHKTTNEIVGYVEHSFSMGFNPERVNVITYDSKKTVGKVYLDKYHAKSTMGYYYRIYKKDVNMLNKKFSEYEFKVFRIGSKHCPVKIDWTERILMKRKQMKTEKFIWRNPKFTLREDVKF